MAAKVQTEAKRDEDIAAMLDLCFTMFESEGLSYTKIATKSNLSLSTIYRLYTYGGSQFCRIGTIQKLSAAAGFELKLVDGKLKVNLAA